MAIKKKNNLRPEKKQISAAQKIKNYFAEQEKKVKKSKMRQMAFFVLGFLAAYILLTFFISFIPEITLKQAVGEATQGILLVEGIITAPAGIVDCTEGSWIGGEITNKCYSFFVLSGSKIITPQDTQNLPLQEKTIIISWLCTGILEILVLVSAILASFGVNWRKKAVGIIAAIVLGIIFNLIRITVTINLILSQNIQTVELAHDLLFRVILFIYIVAVYVLWFYWAAKNAPENK